MTGVTLRWWAAALVLVAAATPATSGALPLYASREGRTCNTCHIDPNGGGIRNDFGFMYGKNRHSMGVEDKWASVTVDPQLNEWIRLGLDLRFMYYASHDEGESIGEDQSTFFPMQGNLTLAVSPLEHLTVVATHGIIVQSGFLDDYVAREFYGLFHGLPMNGFVQVGRFRVPFGLRQEDHTSFTRAPEFYYFDSQRPDAGIEVGSVGTHWYGQVALTDGGEPFAEKARLFSAKLGRASRLVQFGVSGLHRDTDGADATVDRWTGFASATHGKLTILGEYGGGTTEDPLGTSNLQAAFGEAVYRVSRGLNLRAKIDYIGPRGNSGPPRANRVTGEIDVVPMPFTQVKLSYRKYNYSSIPDGDEYFAMLFIPF